MGKKINKKKVVKDKNLTCKVCRHDHVLEIETAMLIEKLPSREVSKMLEDNGWEPVSYPTILSHMKNHVDGKRELTVRYLDDRRRLLEGANEDGENPEVDEMAVRLKELKNLDMSIHEARILLKMSSKELQNQMSLRLQHPLKNGKTKSGKKVTGSDGNDPDVKHSYVPVQRDLISLYKGASEELRKTIETKLTTLGIDAASRTADNMESLLDIILQDDEEG